MKKFLRLICLGFVFLFICAGMAQMNRFPVDAQPFVEKKYSGWNGVLQVWICSKWSPAGSFIQWLNRCASNFETAHEGIYLEFTPVQVDTIRQMKSNGLRLPDIIFFSSGVIDNPDMLIDLQPADILRSDLMDYGDQKALPVALGGYGWAYNTALCDGIPESIAEFNIAQLPEDTDGQCFSAALIGLLSGESNESDVEFVSPDTGIDLGLPVSSMGETLFCADSLDSFMDGELAYIPVDAKIIAQLNRLKETGRDPDWRIAISGTLACTDQILLTAIPKQPGTTERTALAEEFIAALLEPESQAGLSDIGAFSVTGTNIYSSFSDYSEMNDFFNTHPLWLPPCFSEYSHGNKQAIVHGFLKGEIPAKNALGLMGFEGL